MKLLENKIKNPQSIILCKNSTEIFYIVFSIYIVCSLFDYTVIRFMEEISILIKCIKYIIYGYFIVNYIINVIKKKSISLIEIFFVFISMVVYYFSKANNILILTLVLLNLKNKDLDKIIKYYSISIINFTFMIIFASILKLIPDWTYMKGTEAVRHSLGFNYPTLCSTAFFFCMMSRFYVCKGKLSKIEIILNLIISIVLFYYTDSKNGFILSVLMIIAEIYIHLKHNTLDSIKIKNKKNLCLGIEIFPVIIFIALIILNIFYANGVAIVNKINLLLTHRIHYAAKAITEYGINLFGQPIEWIGIGGVGYIDGIENKEYNFVDIAYWKLLINYGIVYTSIFIVLFCKTLRYACENDKSLTFILILISIWAIIEPNINEIYLNIYIIFFVRVLENLKYYKKFSLLGIDFFSIFPSKAVK